MESPDVVRKTSMSKKETYLQTTGVAMGPSYACLFMGHQEARIHETFVGSVPFQCKRYIDDCFGISDLPEPKLLRYLGYFNTFHPI